MKRLAYVIEGQSFDWPAQLPDGFTVKAVEVVDPRDVTVESRHGTPLRVRPESHFGEGVTVEFEGQVAVFSKDDARQVRDCLNAILGDDESSPRPVASAPGSDEDQGRVFKDISGDLWFEVEPNTFTVADDWESARAGGTHGYDFACWTFARLAHNYDGSLTDVTDTWQVNP